MNPKDKLRQQMCWVIGKIHEEYLSTPSSKPVTFDLPTVHVVGGGFPDKERQVNLVRKLAEEGFVNITDYSGSDWSLGEDEELRVKWMNAIMLTTTEKKLETASQKYACEIVADESSELEEELDNGWLHIKEFLSHEAKIGDIQYDGQIMKIVEYIANEREELIYEGKIPEKEYIVLVPGADSTGPAVNDYNVGKFLVLLERQGIVRDLHLPMFVRELENKEVVEVKTRTHVWMSTSYAIKEAIRYPAKFRNEIPRLKIKNWKKFLEIKEKVAEVEEKSESAKVGDETAPEEAPASNVYAISVKDREIWVNDWRIGRPHATGAPMELLLHVLPLAPNTKVTREGLPTYVKELVGTKNLRKLLEACGFTREIRKVFFSRVGPKSFVYEGDKRAIASLEKAGVNVNLLLKELEVAHLRMNRNRTA